jgi:tetratricopeptide (TPR) repeat protein
LRLDRAEEYCTEALAKRPDDGPTLVRVAAFHLRRNKPVRAEPVLRRLLDSAKDMSAGELTWARRELAMVLAASGDEYKCAEAEALLGAVPKPGGDAAAYLRVQAFVLGARPAGRAEALRWLDVEGKASPLPADEQLRLAQLYDAEGRWPEARERLATLVTVDRQNPEYLAYLTDGLLRDDQAEEAGSWLARLEGLEQGRSACAPFGRALPQQSPRAAGDP